MRLLLLFVFFCFVRPAVAASVSADVCGVAVAPAGPLQPFVDAGTSTQVWRQRVSACGASLSVMFWNQGDHWAMTVERVVPNPLSARAAAAPLKATLRENGKRVAGIDGPLYEFQIAYAENRQLSPRTTPDKLRAARQVPPIAMLGGGKKPAYLTQSSWAVKPYTSLKDGPLNRGMPNTGERPDIGVIHEWCAMWLNYPSDYWWRACLESAKDQANIPWHVALAGRANLFTEAKMRVAGFDYRQPAGQRIELPAATHDMLTFQNDPANYYVYKNEKSGWSLDGAHQPFALLVPYMVTRHPYFLYLAHYQFGVQLGGVNVGAEWGGRLDYKLPTIMIDQERGIAWSFRTLTQTILMTPATTPDWLYSKDKLKPFLQESVTRWSKSWKAKRDYWASLTAGKGGKPIGEPYTVKVTGRQAYALQPWEQDYLGQSLGFAKWAGVTDVEPLYGQTRDMLLARYGTGSVFRAVGAPFTMIFSDPKTGTLAKSMADVARFTPAENITYGTNKQLIVGTGGAIGQWTDMSWHVQGALSYCVLNGDVRCREPLSWWNAQADEKATYAYDKWRVAIE
jgi:hypothetical protein